MLVQKAFKVALIPNRNQEVLINKTIGCARFVYNRFLARRKELYSCEQKTLNYTGIDRNPGIVLLWTTRRYNVVRVSNGILFKLGIPSNVTWLCQGRQATKAECLESIESGYPALLELAKLEGRGAVMELEFLRDRAMRLLPKR
jgi:transposase